MVYGIQSEKFNVDTYVVIKVRVFEGISRCTNKQTY